MRALVFDGTLSFRPRHPEPAATAGDTLIRVRQAGICATDLEITKGYMGFRGVLGHEFVGEVVHSVDRELIGRRVAGEINVVCGRCDLCLSGLATHCRNRTVLGILNRDGAFAEFIRLPAINLHALPDSVDDDAATLSNRWQRRIRSLSRSALMGANGLRFWATAGLGCWWRRCCGTPTARFG
jgi:threonine dehydrogenase-like Zn-dependent dehydrogenase